jgi:DNA-directed RNA polymerase specialized sigma24 family protein
MSNPQNWGTLQFKGVIGDTEERWRRQVFPEMQSSASFQARVHQDPFLRDAYAVLTAESDGEAVEAAKQLRGRWFPFHALNDDNSKRTAWLDELQQVTRAEAQERGSSEQEIEDFLAAQSLWLAVLRSPLKLTGVETWQQGQRRWIQESRASAVRTTADGDEPRGNQPVAYTPPSPERFITETRLLALESLDTALLCETVGKRLPEDQQTAMRLSYVTGLMEDEIASQMGVDQDFVSQLKRHALGALRAGLVK